MLVIHERTGVDVELSTPEEIAAYESILQCHAQADAGKYDNETTQVVEAPESWAAQLLHGACDGKLVEATHEAEKDTW